MHPHAPSCVDRLGCRGFSCVGSVDARLNEGQCYPFMHGPCDPLIHLHGHALLSNGPRLEPIRAGAPLSVEDRVLGARVHTLAALRHEARVAFAVVPLSEAVGRALLGYALLVDGSRHKALHAVTVLSVVYAMDRARVDALPVFRHVAALAVAVALVDALGGKVG